MKLQDPVQVKIGEYNYYIRPFPAFKAANISGEVVSVVMPILGAALPLMGANTVGSIMDQDISELSPAITKGFESLSGDKCEKLLRDLLIRNGNIAVEIEGEAKTLDEDLSNVVFCGEIQDMYILAFNVIKVNYGGFFKKLGDQSGKVAELITKNAL